MSKDKSYLAQLAFLSSIILGLGYIVLFLWKLPGISYLLFYLLTLFLLFWPYISSKKNEREQLNIPSSYSVLLLLGGILSLTYLYRLNSLFIYFGILTLPWLFTYLFIASFKKEVVENLTWVRLIALPFVLLFAWFKDLIDYVRNLKLRKVGSERNKDLIRRVLVGVVVSIPVLLVFTLLLSSADTVFSDLIEKTLGDTFGDLFGDFASFVKLIGKLIVGGTVGLYLAVLNYGIWNKESALSDSIKKTVEGMEINIEKKWDFLSSSVFVGMVNLLFVVFVVIQFFYLFAGEGNIIGPDSNFTYSEYARKGFSELLLVSLIVYGLVYILNLKVAAKEDMHKIAFKGNLALLLILTLIISFSAHMRLWLVEDIYGFTELRLFGHLITGMVEVVLVVSLIGLGLKNANRLMTISSILILLVGYVVLMVTPVDWVIAKLNYNRYLENNQLDLPYMLSLSDEALPVVIDLYEDNDTPEEIQHIVGGYLYEYRDDLSEKRENWQSFNILHESNEAKLNSLFDENDSPVELAENDLRDFLVGYAEALEQGDYEEAHEEYWSEYSEIMDKEELEQYTVEDMTYTDIPDFEEWSVLNVGELGDRTFDYWVGMYVYYEVTYEYESNFGRTQKITRDGYMRVRLENGEWRIMNDDLFTLATFDDPGDSVYYEENRDLDHLR
jgi:hypothetical protein